MRTALFAAAALACVFGVPAALATAASADTAQCAPSNVRVYFSHGSSALDATARDVLAAAQRNMAGCEYAAVRISVDASSSLSAARGEAVRTALSGREWNQAQIAARSYNRPASMSSSPEFVQVAMSDERLPTDAQAPLNPNVGM
ncbi:hypothetical protein [Terricaulis sp.]|uniref:hypothetical protein n=1 Tax=Terricaulis sp. TaxID=2768686 RepID=UPI0037834A0F